MATPRYGRGFNATFAKEKLTVGVTFPIESYRSPVPVMKNQIELVRHAEELGFAVVWSRDVPLLDPGFGDAGQMYDPWVWLGYVAAHTSKIALGTGSIILPLRAPTDLAKSAASTDQLSQGRLVMGVATGDRPIEYSVYERSFDQRDEIFRNTFRFIQETTHRPNQWNDQHAVASRQVDLLPKCYSGDLPLLVTGNSRQSVEWIAENASGWLMYPRPLIQQTQVLVQWQQALESTNHNWKPFAQSLYIDLTANPDQHPAPIHLGFRLGRNHLIEHLNALRNIGVNHVTFNLRFSTRPVAEVLEELGDFVIPEFPTLADKHA